MQELVLYNGISIATIKHLDEGQTSPPVLENFIDYVSSIYMGNIETEINLAQQENFLNLIFQLPW